MVRPIRSLQNLILEGDPFGIVFLEPCFRGVLIGEYREVVRVSAIARFSHPEQPKPFGARRPGGCRPLHSGRRLAHDG